MNKEVKSALKKTVCACLDSENVPVLIYNEANKPEKENNDTKSLDVCTTVVDHGCLMGSNNNTQQTGITPESVGAGVSCYTAMGLLEREDNAQTPEKLQKGAHRQEPRGETSQTTEQHTRVSEQKAVADKMKEKRNEEKKESKKAENSGEKKEGKKREEEEERKGKKEKERKKEGEKDEEREGAEESREQPQAIVGPCEKDECEKQGDIPEQKR